MAPSSSLIELRARIRVLERPADRDHNVLPFGLPDLDRRLPGLGLKRGALHEVADPHCGTAGVLFAAGIAARLPGRILWCWQRATRERYLPGLLMAGLDPDRVLCAEAADGAGVLQVIEEGLRHPGLACVVGELARLPMTASRRLNLAAEGSGVMALALSRGGELAGSLPTAALTRWRVAHLPSPGPLIRTPAGMPAAPGRALWRLELTRCRGGEPASWIVEACDAQGRLAQPAVLANRPARPAAAPAALRRSMPDAAWRAAPNLRPATPLGWRNVG